MIYKFAIVFSILFLLFIIGLVKRNKLDEKYAILWLIFSIVIAIVSIWPEIITWMALKLSVFYPPSLMFLIAFFIVGTYIVHISITMTKQNKMIITLTQELGLLKLKENESKDKKSK